MKAKEGFEDDSYRNNSALRTKDNETKGCHTTLSAEENEAVLGGFESTVGMTSEDALRWERVTVPSLFIHMMTMGVLAICVPKPLQGKCQESQTT